MLFALRCIRASFNPEILQARVVKGLSLVNNESDPESNSHVESPRKLRFQVV